jgi:hypothetical protein
LCASVFVVPITIYLWVLGVNWHGYGLHIFIPILLSFSLGSLWFLIDVYRGLKVRNRIPENSRYRVT